MERGAANRELNREQRAFVRRNGRHRKVIWLPMVLGVVFAAIGAPGSFGWEVGLPPEMAADEETGRALMGVVLGSLASLLWVGLGLVLFGFLFTYLWNRRMARKQGVFSAAQLRTTLAEGRIVRATVVGSFVDHGYTYGPWPFNVALFDVGQGAPACLGVFDDRAFAFIEQGSVVDVYWSPSVPGLAIPVALVDGASATAR